MKEDLVPGFSALCNFSGVAHLYSWSLCSHQEAAESMARVTINNV